MRSQVYTCCPGYENTQWSERSQALALPKCGVQGAQGEIADSPNSHCAGVSMSQDQRLKPPITCTREPESLHKARAFPDKSLPWICCLARASPIKIAQRYSLPHSLDVAFAPPKQQEMVSIGSPVESLDVFVRCTSPETDVSMRLLL